LTPDLIESAASGFEFPVLSFVIEAERFYANLISAAASDNHHEPSLGGKLLYAGELNAEARALLVAANIAGAASLTVSTDAAERKQAIRDGVVDFLVTSLDEALRILKNEIRKRETVAVCVALDPEACERDFARAMLERGAKPDLTRPVEFAAAENGQTLLAWSVESSPAIWMPKLDAVAAECLRVEEQAAHRWLRLAPRYLGRLAQGVRLLRCADSSAATIMERFSEEAAREKIAVHTRKFA
jgi:hypothetical protein